MSAVLQVEGLRTLFKTDDGEFPAVDGVSFSVEAGRTLAIVGESGCGKSVTALSIMGFEQGPQAFDLQHGAHAVPSLRNA